MSGPVLTEESLRQAIEILKDQTYPEPPWKNFDEYLTMYVGPVYGKKWADLLREWLFGSH